MSGEDISVLFLVRRLSLVIDDDRLVLQRREDAGALVDDNRIAAEDRAGIHVLERRAREFLIISHLEKLPRREGVLDVVDVLAHPFDARLQFETTRAGD